MYSSPTTKKVIFVSGISGGIILFPTLKAPALEEVGKAVEAAKGGPAETTKVPFLTLTGLKTMVDSTASKMAKTIAGAKVFCCGSYLGANIIQNTAFFSPQVRVATSACCCLSFLGLSILEAKSANLIKQASFKITSRKGKVNLLYLCDLLF